MKEGFRPMCGIDFSTYSGINLPQFTGRTSEIAPNMIFAIVMLRRFGFSGLRIGKMNSMMCHSLEFWQFLGWNPSSGCDPLRVANYLCGWPIPRPSTP